MKKISKLAVCAVTCAALGAFALGGCGGDANAMTEADAATLNAAFVQAQAYDGSYTLNEELSSYVYYLSTTQYSKGSADVTYDSQSGTMGYAIDIESDSESYSMGYYTVPQSDGSIMQYVNVLGIKMGTAYAADESIDLYYTSFSDCMEAIYGLDLSKGASITTVDGYIEYWEDFLGDSVNSLGEVYGISLDFTEVETKVESIDNGLVLTFSSDAALKESANFMGVEISAYSVDYSLSVKIENNVIAEISTNINQDLTLSYGGESVNMRGIATNKDTFTMTYDSSIIPSDFSDYAVEESGDDII